MQASDYDGGYYAIKGFLFQFDKTIIEILRAGSCIGFEIEQDIATDLYHIQVKNRETQQYKPWKIRPAIRQLLELAEKDCSRHIHLYCHFADKQPQAWSPSLEELQQIVGLDENWSIERITPLKDRLAITFSSDFQSQFTVTLDLIKEKFDLPSLEEAVIYHAIIRSHLLECSVKPKIERSSSLNALKDICSRSQKIIVEAGYREWLSEQTYNHMICKKYFTINDVNIRRASRCFVFDCSRNFNILNAVKAVTDIVKKFYVKGKTLVPYFVFHSINDQLYIDFKREMKRTQLPFCDGTLFHGDEFDWNVVLGKHPMNRNFDMIFLEEEKLSHASIAKNFDEIYQFFISTIIDVSNVERSHHVRISIKDLSQVPLLVKKVK
ncbi:hypothetical protein GGE65_005677 [Skermanella aerolata]|uniref:hypothetical protein n=1 Tax=Skermanella aerolata TaxID=393310 RepID=UPI003D1DEA8B